PTSLPVALSYARSIAPRGRLGAVVASGSPAITSVLVTSAPTAPDCPVRGIVSPFSAGWLRTLSGVSPCATCQRISPRSRSIALSRPYGGLSSGKPCGSASLLVAASPVEETTVPAAFDTSGGA